MTITIDELHASVRVRVPMSRRTLYRHMKRAGVGHVGPKQRPQRYGKDAPRRLLSFLVGGAASVRVLPSMSELRDARRKGAA